MFTLMGRKTCKNALAHPIPQPPKKPRTLHPSIQSNPYQKERNLVQKQVHLLTKHLHFVRKNVPNLPKRNTIR